MLKSIRQSFKNFFCDINLTCEECGKEIFNDAHFCDDCLKLLPFNNKCICSHCGRQTTQSYIFCVECKQNAGEYSEARSAFVYEDVIPILISAFKNGNKKYLAEVFVDYMLPYYFKSFIQTDYLIYVPMFELDEKKRTYNQSKLLAMELSNKVGTIIAENVVEKIIETKHQKTLSRKARRSNLNGAFRIRKRKIIKDKHLLIIDDIFTTGTTAEIISKKLLKAGAKSVGVLTIASVPFNK